MPKILIVFWLAFILVATLAAGPYEDAMDAYARDDFATVLTIIRPFVQKGEAWAQIFLGSMYYDGTGVPQDYAQAAAWYRKAADQGDAGAQKILALMYSSGYGVPQDYAQAAAWFRKAADQGDASAQLNLGSMYEHGQGVPQNYAQAGTYYRKAADQGNAFAQLSLGGMYEHGQGMPHDYIHAHMWYNLAASRFNATEEYYRDKAITGRDRVTAQMTPKQIAEAQKLASEWKPNSMSQLQPQFQPPTAQNSGIPQAAQVTPLAPQAATTQDAGVQQAAPRSWGQSDTVPDIDLQEN